MDRFVKTVVLVLVLSATVLVLERIVMAELTFGHQWIEVDRMSIGAAGERIEYEYEYRVAEYEYGTIVEAVSSSPFAPRKLR